MNLYKAFIEAAPIKKSLTFGHTENVIISAVDFEQRTNKGMPVNANTFIKLVKVNPETRKALAAFEGSFWNLDHTKADFAESNFIDQLTTLSAIVSALGEDSDSFMGDVLVQAEIETEEDIAKLATTKAGVTKLMSALKDGFKKAINDKIGDNSPLLKCKLVANKKGFLNLPKEEGWILPMDSDEELPIISSAEKKTYDNSLNQPTTTTAVPDTVAESGEEEVATGGDDPLASL